MRIILAFLVVFAGLCCKPNLDGTNSKKLSKDQVKQLKSRANELRIFGDSNEGNADQFEQGIRLLQKDYPAESHSYNLMMTAITHREYFQQPDKAKNLANELVAGSAPDEIKTLARGIIHRLESLNKSISLKFTAVDGRKVDLSEMKGKVVLVDFWTTWCGPCVTELPRIKAAYEKFRGQGFEVIGLSSDENKDTLQRFLNKNGVSWPQHFDGKCGFENKFESEFGVNGFPHMFLVDKQGRLRFDNVRAKDGFEEQITKLLAEQ